MVPFFTNCKIMEFIVITDKYCVSHMCQRQSWCDLNMQKAPKKLWQLRLVCDIFKILRCDKLWLAIKHESHLWYYNYMITPHTFTHTNFDNVLIHLFICPLLFYPLLFSSFSPLSFVQFPFILCTSSYFDKLSFQLT